MPNCPRKAMATVVYENVGMRGIARPFLYADDGTRWACPRECPVNDGDRVEIEIRCDDDQYAYPVMKGE